MSSSLLCSAGAPVETNEEGTDTDARDSGAAETEASSLMPVDEDADADADAEANTESDPDPDLYSLGRYAPGAEADIDEDRPAIGCIRKCAEFSAFMPDPPVRTP